jgi:hypothetical protein
MDTTHFGKRSTLGDLVHASHQGTKICRSNDRIADQFDQVIDDDYSPPLHLHASIVQGASEKRNENSEGRCCNFGNEGRIGE